MGSILNDIKSQVKKSGTNKGKLLYFKSGVKIRVRFRQDMEDGMKVLFHDSFSLGINMPCQEIFGRKCKYCGDEELRHRDQYIWSVYDHESKEDKLLMGPVNNCSPIPLLAGFYETYGTLTDRDYVISKNGQGTNGSFSIVPMDKAKFRNEKSKPFSESKVLAILDKAFPDDDVADDEDEDEKPKKKKAKVVVDDEDEAPVKKTKKKAVEVEEEEDDEDETTDYEEMSPKQLYKLCVDREIKAKPKKDKDYYIELLEEYDENNEEDEDEEDEWDD